MLQTGNKLKYYIGIECLHWFEEGSDPKYYQQKLRQCHYVISHRKNVGNYGTIQIIVFNNVLTGEEKAVVLTNSVGV